MSCPCGSGRKYEDCCESIISGRSPAATPEALMRARYSAYERGEVDFLLSSLHPDGAGGADREATRAWSQSADWHGLEVLSSSGGGPNDEEGVVEFVAKYSLQGEPQRHHERARFKRHNGAWRYLDGDQLRPDPIVGPKVRLGRNDECICGSGKKFKKCCFVVFDTGATQPEVLVRARFTAQLVGESRFLERSLHPEATQATLDNEQELPTRLQVVDVKGTGDEVRVRVIMEDAESERLEQVQILKKLGARWMHLRTEATA